MVARLDRRFKQVVCYGKPGTFRAADSGKASKEDYIEGRVGGFIAREPARKVLLLIINQCMELLPQCLDCLDSF